MICRHVRFNTEKQTNSFRRQIRQDRTKVRDIKIARRTTSWVLVALLCAAGRTDCIAHDGQTHTEAIVASSTTYSLTPAVTSWLQNQTGITGSSSDPTINSIVSLYQADVQQVLHDETDVYILATGIPSYSIGPWPDGNPDVATDRHWTIRIPKSPEEETGAKTATGLDAIGHWVDGVAIFDPWDGFCFDDDCNWMRNASIAEAGGQDSANGHPSPAPEGGAIGSYGRGVYHHHSNPTALREQLGDDGSSHSPILGFAYDGFPVYGPWAYENTDGTGSIVLMESSYQLHSGQRPTGADSPGGEYDGTYLQDWEYVEGLGDLDEHNGRFAITPEFPEGTYAYFVTLDAELEAAYPYVVGPEYYGVVLQENLDQTVEVADNAVAYTPVPEPSALALVAVGLGLLASRPGRHR